MAFGKKNEIKVDPFRFNTCLLGESGIGKTTIIKEMCEKYLPEGGYLFAECGKEDGSDAIFGINAINCPEFSMDYDEYTNSVGFSELIEDIIENKTTEYPNLKVLVIDTYDQLREIFIPEVIRMSNRENPEKPPVKSIKAAFGGYMAGEDKVDEMILDMLWSLKKVGVQFILIGHLKQREITDAITGESYTQVTTDMSIRSFNKIKTKLHFLGVATIDREIIKEKKAKSKDTKGVLVGETRKITFRDDNYSIDSKSRFSSISPTCEFTPDALYETLMNAIKAEQAKSGKSFDEAKKEQEKADAEKLKEVAKAEKAKKAAKEVSAIVSEITDFIKENKSDLDKIKPIIALSKELGYENPTMIDKLEDAEKILKLVK